MEKAIIANLRKMPVDELRAVADVSEGLENRIKRAAIECFTFEDLADQVKSKRYTHSRIRRILLNSYLGITKHYKTYRQRSKIITKDISQHLAAAFLLGPVLYFIIFLNH
jgi:predicted nucleotidyltransferase